ncbi:MAG: pyruvate, phosphate dikinase [Treponema sp.]|jgi:pyruvate,orthophosphate dikinase|nr:pyruvate, phosphate dikinase [Treponema sp.]
MAKRKNVYFFGEGKAEGNADMRDILGGKGANLAEMTNLGIPVPPGFTISTEVCAAYYENKRKYPPGLEDEVLNTLNKLEKMMGKKLGDSNDPLLVSVRSGAPVSMPGMMDTILNLGMNDQSVRGLAAKTGNPRFAWDAYRRFIQMYGDVVLLVPGDHFEAAIASLKKEGGLVLDTELSDRDLERLVEEYKGIIKEYSGRDFPQNPLDQLWGSINAVFGSWMNDRAIEYRRLEDIRGVRGTAVNIQSMVFGNFGEDSGTGVCFSRDPSTGENEFYGEYLMNAQGEDVVAGIRTPEKISTLEQKNKAIYDQLVNIKNRLEYHFRDMQDMEFTVQQGKLFILQTRNGKRAGAAAVKCAVDMVAEKLIDKHTAVLRVSPAHLDQLLHPMIDPAALQDAASLTRGLNASPGAGCGRIVFSAREAEEWHLRGEKVLLVRKDTSPEDIGGMVVSQGILTSTGGMTSHAAVVARGMGTPCIAGAKGVSVQGKQVLIGSKTFNEGDWITIDGSSGDVYEGSLPLVAPNISRDMSTFLSWCDDIRAKSVRGNLKGFEVRTNADQPEDAKRAFDFGAQGVGLCRTEHMFFDKEKLIHFRAMIVADTEDERKDALGKILPLQQKDFFGIFKAMEGRPVTIRLLDPPLHEFVPHTEEEVAELAEYLQVEPRVLIPKIEKLYEANPMLGHRGCRLAVTYPEIYDMQVEAIARAAVECVRDHLPVDPEIMIPIVVTARELKLLRPRAEAIITRVLDEAGVKLSFKIGTMIEVPRAAIRAAHIAKYADFFSFGTNDLTQMTFAFSRDDVASFLPTYLKKQVLDVDPFKSIDEEGVGFLIRNAVEQGRMVNPKIKVGICGEHGGDPRTIDFCFRAGLTYVSCSPYRVPLARLAAAQAVINNTGAAAEAEKKQSPSSRSKGNRAAKSTKAAKAVKADKVDKPVKAAKADKAAKPAKADKAAKPAKAGRPAKIAKTVKVDKPAKSKAGRPAKTVKADKPIKPVKADKAAKPAKAGRSAKADKAAKPTKAGRPAKAVKADKSALVSKEPAKRGRKPKK